MALNREVAGADTMSTQTYETAYRRLAGPIQRDLERLVGDHHEAEDLTQETFLRLYLHWPRARCADTLAAWVRRVARNTAVDRLRRRREPRPRAVTPDQVAAPPPTDDPESLLPRLVLAVDRMPRALALTLLLAAIDRRTPLEISHLTGTTPGNVKVRLHRARTFLASAWHVHRHG